MVKLICTHKVFEDLACLSAVGEKFSKTNSSLFQSWACKKNANGRPMILAENRKSDIRNKLRQESIGKKVFGPSEDLVAL